MNRSLRSYLVTTLHNSLSLNHHFSYSYFSADIIFNLWVFGSYNYFFPEKYNAEHQTLNHAILLLWSPDRRVERAAHFSPFLNMKYFLLVTRNTTQNNNFTVRYQLFLNNIFIHLSSFN